LTYQHQFKGPDINERLRQQAARLVATLGISGKMRGENLWVTQDPRGAHKEGTYSINFHKGVWNNFSDPAAEEHGDFISLIACMHRCRQGDAIKWALDDFLGLVKFDRDGRPVDNIAPSPEEVAAIVRKQRLDQEAEAERALAHKKIARRMWLDAEPLTGKDPASLYLLGRGIDVMQLRDGPPGALRWTMKCLARPENVELPAMLANVSKRGHGQVATHRTYLDFSGGRWTKAFKGAPGKVSAKRVIGKFAGAAIRLTKGRAGTPLDAAEKGEWVIIAEGIENALSAALVKPDLRAISAVALGNLGNVELPPAIEGVFIVADNDKQEGAAQALNKAMDHYARLGIEPVVVRADERFKDFNDWQNDKRDG
jgi:hypothetical protein